MANGSGKRRQDRLVVDWAPLPQQLQCELSSLIPERRLVAAVMLDGLRALSSRSLILSMEARAWVEAEGSDTRHFTFDDCCRILGRDPGLTRAMALTKRLRMVRGSRQSNTPRLCHQTLHKNPDDYVGRRASLWGQHGRSRRA